MRLFLFRVTVGGAGLRKVAAFLKHYLLTLLVDFGHEIILALFILAVDDPRHLFLLIEHAAIHDQLLLLGEYLLRHIGLLLHVSTTCLLGDQARVEDVLLVLLAFVLFLDLLAVTIALLLLLQTFLVEAHAHVQVVGVLVVLVVLG